ncbi:MAG: tRNA (adenine-N1)-methyltransferase [Anaerolineae bacterium]
MSDLATEGQLALLISSRGKRFIVLLRAGDALHTHEGIIRYDEIIGQPWGRVVKTQLGKPYLVLQPSTHDLILHVRRQSQIVYPKEAGYILLKMNIHPGVRVIEAGSGSGGLTIALARAVAPFGRVYSYENRPDMQRLAIRNITQLGLQEWVEFKLKDIAEGFEETAVDALFLDVRTPWDYLPRAGQALKPGGFFGALMPTTNQVSQLIAGLEVHHFCHIEVEEIFLRAYKPVAERLRPADIMVGHTGYLVFARWIPDVVGRDDNVFRKGMRVTRFENGLKNGSRLGATEAGEMLT